MARVLIQSRDELRAQRATLLRLTGLSEEALRARATDYELTAEQADALDEIDEIDFLLAV